MKNPVERDGDDFARIVIKTFGGIVINPILSVVN
jgi:hypothetical protein